MGGLDGADSRTWPLLFTSYAPGRTRRHGASRDIEHPQGANYLRPYAPGRTRTCDPRLRRPVLYPAELRALVTSSARLRGDPAAGVSKLATGIEPVTSSLPRMRSTPELREPATASGGQTGAAGLEPATAGFGDRCSAKLSYAPTASAWLGADLNHRHPRFQRGALPS